MSHFYSFTRPTKNLTGSLRKVRRDTDLVTMKHILLLEDDIELVEMIKQMKEENGWNIDFATSSGDALGLLAKKPYDAMILDWNLPDFNADYFVNLSDALYRTHSETHNYDINFKVPVVTFSGNSEAKAQLGDSEYFVQSGYWSKPISYKDLEAKINQLILTVPN